MSTYRQAAQGINASAAGVLGIALIIGMMGIQQWHASKSGSGESFSTRVAASYSWKFYATIATFITVFAIAISIVGNGVNMAFRREEEPRRNGATA